MRRLVVVGSFVVCLLAPLAVGAAVTPLEGFLPSFDGTQIHFFLFLPSGASSQSPVPVVLRTHGWGGSAESSEGTETLHKLLGAGYAVLTWDQRGFGRSGGQAEIDSPVFEGRDVKALIDYASGRPEIEKVNGDPVVGMTGGSYAGGIQFSAASIDPRIDAIAPEIAWNDLPLALFPSNVPKFGWDVLLYAVGQSGYRGYVEQQSFAKGEVSTLDPNIHESFWATTATNDPSPWISFYAAHSVKNYLGTVSAPALIIQGTIDTLFPMNHGIANYLTLKGQGVPARLFLYNSGHSIGSAVPEGSARETADCAILKWFAIYLKNEPPPSCPDATADSDAARAIPNLTAYQDQTGAWHTATGWPVATQTASFSGSAANLLVTPAPTSGGDIVKGNPDQSAASARIDVLTAASATQIIGVPHVSGTVSGNGPEAFLFFKLVDADTGDVLDDEVTPLRASPDAATAFDMDLNGVSYLLPSGHKLVLEISTGSLMYTNSRTPAVVNLSVSGTVPTL